MNRPLLEAFEDIYDIAYVQGLLDSGVRPIPYEQARKRLGLVPRKPRSRGRSAPNIQPKSRARRR